MSGLDRIGQKSPLRMADGVGSGGGAEAAPSGEAAPTEVTLKINAAREVWYEYPTGTYVKLNENAAASAEKDRQVSEPGTPPASGFPKFNTMMEDAEIPGSPEAIAAAAAAAPLEDYSSYTTKEGLRAKMGRDPIREPGKSPYWVMENGDALVQNLRDKGPVRLKQGDLLRMYKKSWVWADGAFTEATPEQIEEDARRKRGPARKRARGGGEPAAGGAAEPVTPAGGEGTPRPDRRGDRPRGGERMSDNESFAEGMTMFERIYDPNDTRERKHKMAPVAFEAAIVGRSDAVIERIIDRIHNKGKDFPAGNTLRRVWEDIKARNTRGGERGRGGRERGRDRGDERGGRERPERRNTTLEEARDDIEDAFDVDDDDKPDAEELADVIVDAIKGLPQDRYSKLSRDLRRNKDIDPEVLTEALQDRRLRKLRGNKERSESKKEAKPSAENPLANIDKEIAEAEARLKKLLQG